jgi:hypothetical protein
MNRKRSKNLGDADIKQIVQILDGWSGKLTWNALIDAIEIRMFSRYTRQTLHKHERIRNAYELIKTGKSTSGEKAKTSQSPQLQAAIDRIARLEAENKRLESENTKLLEQFVRWAYNAHTRGLSKDFLNNPLPSIHRGNSK